MIRDDHDDRRGIGSARALREAREQAIDGLECGIRFRAERSMGMFRVVEGAQVQGHETRRVMFQNIQRETRLDLITVRARVIALHIRPEFRLHLREHAGRARQGRNQVTVGGIQILRGSPSAKKFRDQIVDVGRVDAHGPTDTRRREARGMI